MSSFTQIDEGLEGEEQGNKKLKSCFKMFMQQTNIFYGVYFLGFGVFFFFFDRLSLINSVLQVKP